MAKKSGSVVAAGDAGERFPELGFELPKVTAAEKRRAQRLLAALDARWPDARCELNSTTPHELLVATILSAQATDAGVNKATPGLFAEFPTPAAYAAATPKEIEPYIKSIGLFRGKARSIHEAMRAIVERYGGEVPRTMAELLTLRGVARKTANVVLGNAFGIQAGMPVDTHVLRLSQRFGLVTAKDAGKGGRLDAEKVERKLLALFPRERWCDVSHKLIWHGRSECKARGGTCETNAVCREFHVGGEETKRRRDKETE